MANMPTRNSPSTIHFSVAQLGSQEWLINLAMPPFTVASIISFGLQPTSTSSFHQDGQSSIAV